MWYPAMSGLTPDVVPDEQLQSANALGLDRDQCRISSPAMRLGGVLVALVGPGWAIAIDSLSFVVSAAALIVLDSSCGEAT
jgi:hypothetical protein